MMETRENYINVLLIDDEEFYFKHYRISVPPEKSNIKFIKENTGKKIRMMMVHKYEDLITECGPAYGNIFGWLKNSLKIMDRIATLEKL